MKLSQILSSSADAAFLYWNLPLCVRQALEIEEIHMEHDFYTVSNSLLEEYFSSGFDQTNDLY